MNRTLPSFAAAALFLLAACAGVGDAPEAATGDAVAVTGGEGTELAIDTSRSAIKWKAAKVTRSHDGGFHHFSGTLTVADRAVTGIKVDIDAGSIWSDTEQLTDHLKSDDFFDVAQHERAVFESSSVAPVDSAGATHIVTGNLAMHGVTRSVTFPATITVDENRVEAKADFIINRRNWEINYSGKANDLISDDVRILLDVVAEGPAVAAAVEAEAGAAE